MSEGTSVESIRIVQPMEHYSIRPATMDDIDVIVTHRRKMMREIRNADEAALDEIEPRFRPWLTERMTNGDYLGWFAVTPEQDVAAGVGIWLVEWPPGLA